MSLIRTIQCRFYGALNRFLRPEQRHRGFSRAVKGIPAIKDTLEALGVPHTEIDCIVVNGRCVRFLYQIRGGERIQVYPDAGKVKLKKIIRRSLKPKPPANPKFVLDVHLGKLARHLRLLGFDVIYQKDMEDAAIVCMGGKSRRIILTRDIGLLKNKIVRHGYFVRATDPKKQIREIVRRFDLAAKMRPFRLCLECNGRIRRIAKSRIENRLPPLTREHYTRFYHCPRCDKIYWQGAHYKQFLKIIKTIRH
ncbi:MAG TPA: twitching motility protein PilT [Candidatus Omnitrophica bacterium]|nr:MAG: hypothetical protein A2Y05_03005 [Omnitrophica WOR_2 bacterium GWA2_53_43]HBO98209.1 twitching motility protein PilT [Candidatus Omnitrophota bacterium]HCI44775.1 twitching motility protein PilT [Candidatus Omnitrophota bacterium]